MVNQIVLPQLPYAYNALEPHISEQIMRLHHDKHHQTYVTNLNKALQKQSEYGAANSLKDQIALQQTIKFNGGGHINHSLFWKNLAPANSSETRGGEGIKKVITNQWGSIDEFKQEFARELTSIQGSGWAWLTKTKNGDLAIEHTKDQDPITASTPLLGIDMWEHAFYPQYYTDKASYIDNIWHVINWKEVNNRYAGFKLL